MPLKINVSELMAALLPDSPSWYNIGSSVSHSMYWGLRDVDHSRPGEPLALTPNVLDVGAAVESAISASALILDRCGRMTGHDPTAQVQQAQKRRAEIDALMKRATTSAWAHVPAEPHRANRAALRNDDPPHSVISCSITTTTCALPNMAIGQHAVQRRLLAHIMPG